MAPYLLNLRREGAEHTQTAPAGDHHAPFHLCLKIILIPIQVSWLRQTISADLALKFYCDQLEQLRAPCLVDYRLHLTCIACGIKADILHDLLIITEDTLIQFSQAKPV